MIARSLQVKINSDPAQRPFSHLDSFSPPIYDIGMTKNNKFDGAMHLAIQANYLIPQYSAFNALLRFVIAAGCDRAEVEKISLLQTHFLGGKIDLDGILKNNKVFHHKQNFPAQWANKLGKHIPALRVESLLPGADVYYSEHIYPGPRAVKIPTIVTVNDIMPILFPQAGQLSAQWIEKQILSWCDQAETVVTISNCTRRDLLERFPINEDRVRVIYSGIDPRFFPVTPDREMLKTRYGLCGDYIFYIGSIGQQKNVTTLVNAFSIIAKKYPALTLALAGQIVPGGEKTVARIQELKLENRVRLLGHVPRLDENDDLIHLFSGAKLFSTASLYEGFGLPPIEAMACGSPVVCSNAGSLEEVTGDAALLHDPMDPDGFAADFSRVLEDEALAKTLTRKGIENARRFSGEKMGQQYIDLFLQVRKDRS